MRIYAPVEMSNQFFSVSLGIIFTTQSTRKKKQDKTSKEERKVCNDFFTNDRSHDYLVDFHLKLDVTSRPLILLTLTANVALELLLEKREREREKITKNLNLRNK